MNKSKMPGQGRGGRGHSKSGQREKHWTEPSVLWGTVWILPLQMPLHLVEPSNRWIQ